MDNYEIAHLLSVAEKVNRIAKMLGDDPLCYWYEKNGKRYLSMFEDRSIHEIPDSFDLTWLIYKEKENEDEFI